MRTLVQTALSSIALAATLLLLHPAPSRAFSLIGGSLSTNQRDVRVFDNFADSTANNNATPDAQFPGYTGAEMALWKSVVEWGSRAHGTGAGDPVGGNILGSGGANFDGSWQGNATIVGTGDQNTISAISSCGGGGTLAYTETPISTGWRIRFCEEYTWQDGPDAISSGFDLQEVGTHEYGHALGLGHSSFGGATMWPSTGAGSEAGRSIHSDDQAGVQHIYGLAASTKPIITSITVATNLITITGSNFAPTGNEVWFTQAAAGGDGTPIKALNQPSTAGGTQIDVLPPPTAGPGDILVKIPGATTGDTLSNAWPVTPLIAPYPPPASYCTGKTNSQGCVPFLTFTGFPSVSDSTPFRIVADQVIPNQIGFFIYSLNGKANLDFHNGKLCVKAPFVRAFPAKGTVDNGTPPCTGTALTNFNNRIQAGTDPGLIAGQQVHIQYRHRDAALNDGFDDGLTNGLEFTISP